MWQKQQQPLRTEMHTPPSPVFNVYDWSQQLTTWNHCVETSSREWTHVGRWIMPVAGECGNRTSNVMFDMQLGSLGFVCKCMWPLDVVEVGGICLIWKRREDKMNHTGSANIRKWWSLTIRLHHYRKPSSSPQTWSIVLHESQDV